MDAGRYREHVKYLAGEELKGRGTGTPELEKAGRYLADQYKAMGLEPAFPGGYLQPFPVTTSARLGSRNRLSDSLAPRKLVANSDFVPFNSSSSAKVSGPVVFAGYGITAPEYNYDDYAGLDVKGKIVLVFRYEPQERDEKSIFAGKVMTRHAQFDAKATNAKMHGARGLLLINNPIVHPNDRDRLEKFGRAAGPSESGIAFLQIKTEIAERWFAAAGRSMKEVSEGIDADLKPRSFVLPAKVKVELETDVVREQKTVHNVAAWLRGETDEYIVIGAHYDHLGLGEQFSLAPSMAGKPHYGADDNASGTAGVLELARHFAQGPKPKRGILFASFTAEEHGLLGSAFLTEHFPAPLDKCVAMVNLDMIGRLREGSVIVGGAGTAKSFPAMLDRLAGQYPGLKLETSEQGGVGSSDHTSFTAKRIPVLFFFTGLHMDYHRPTDTWDKINAEGAVELLGLVARVGEELVSGARPEFVKVEESRASGQSSGGGGGYGPSFGSVPDMAYQGKGVKFMDVREGSPAQKAGLRAGDVMVGFDDRPIDNLYDFTYALRGKQPGDSVAVKVLRAGQPMSVTVKLESRK